MNGKGGGGRTSDAFTLKLEKSETFGIKWRSPQGGEVRYDFGRKLSKRGRKTEREKGERM